MNPIPLDDQWFDEDVARVMANPMHVLNGTIHPDMWVAAMVRLAEETGLEESIRRILLVFDEALDGRGVIEEMLNTPEHMKNLLDLASGGEEATMFRALLENLIDGAKILADLPPKRRRRRP